MTDNISRAGREIADRFLRRLATADLSAEDVAVVDRAATRLAAAAILAPGSTVDTFQLLVLDRDAALAALANLEAAKAIDADQLIRQTALDVILGAIRVGIGIVS